MKFLNENPSTVITPLVRYALIGLAGGLISKGYVTAEQVNTAAGAIVTIGTIAWMVLVKQRTAKNGGAK